MSVGDNVGTVVDAHMVQVILRRDDRGHPCRVVTCDRCDLQTRYDTLFERIPCSRTTTITEGDVAAAALETVQFTDEDIRTEDGRTLAVGDEFLATLDRTDSFAPNHEWTVQHLYDADRPTVRHPPRNCAKHIATVKARLDSIPSVEQRTGAYRATDVVVLRDLPVPELD